MTKTETRDELHRVMTMNLNHIGEPELAGVVKYSDAPSQVAGDIRAVLARRPSAPDYVTSVLLTLDAIKTDVPLTTLAALLNLHRR